MIWWGSWGIFAGLLNAAFIVVLIVGGIHLLRRELPHLRSPHVSPALRLLEERYARGEITREEFLERRAVLANGQGPPGPPLPPAGPPPPPA